MSGITGEISKLTDHYQPFLVNALPARERVRRVYGADSPRMYPFIIEDLAGFGRVPSSHSTADALGEYLGKVQNVIATSPTLAAVANSEFVRWVWDPTLKQPVSSLYTYAAAAADDPGFLIDTFSFREHPEALKYDPKKILGYLATLPSPAIQKAVAIAWGYLPPEFNFPDKVTAAQELIGVANDRWGQLVREGLSVLVNVMKLRPERIAVPQNPRASLLDIARNIASAEIPRVNGTIHVGTTRVLRTQENLQAAPLPKEIMARPTRMVADYLQRPDASSDRLTIAADLGLRVHDVDNALARLTGNVPRSQSFRTSEGFIPMEDIRGKLIQSVEKQGVSLADLSLLNDDEIYALGLLTGTNSDQFFFNTAELANLWQLQKPGTVGEFNTCFWSQRIQSRLQTGLINTEVLKEAATAGSSEQERAAAVFLQEFFVSGESLRSGGLYKVFVEHYQRFDLPLFISAVNLLERTIKSPAANSLLFLETPPKIADAPFIPGAQDLAHYAESIAPESLPETAFGAMLSAVLKKPELLNHFSLEERVIAAIALDYFNQTGSLPPPGEISKRSGNLELNPDQTGQKIKKAAMGFERGEFKCRYATAKSPFRDTPRALLIRDTDRMKPQALANYQAELGPDRSFILALLTGRNHGFQLTSDEMTALWFYRTGNQMLPSEENLLATLNGQNTGIETGLMRDASGKEQVLEQLRRKLTPELPSVPATVELRVDQPVAQLTERVLFKPAAVPEAMVMTRTLAAEYGIKIDRRLTCLPKSKADAIREAGIVFFRGIPVDGITYDLLGWLLHYGESMEPEDLPRINGDRDDYIGPRVAALRALRDGVKGMTEEARRAELVKLKDLLAGEV
jgi:hypothetical protein